MQPLGHAALAKVLNHTMGGVASGLPSHPLDKIKLPYPTLTFLTGDGHQPSRNLLFTTNHNMAPQSAKPGSRPTDNVKKRKEVPQDSGSSKSLHGNDDRGGGARFHKRVKVHDARSLRAQPADAALNNGELDLQAFLNAREFEIKALTEGMRKSKAVNNRRAFQLVPRSLRRRTASHNIKKLPKRLRARSRREQVDDNTPTVEARRRKPKTTRGRIRVEMAKRLGILAEKKRRRKLREAQEKAKNGGEGNDKAEQVSPVMKQLIETRPARPKIRRNLLNDPPKPKAKFRKRQIDKTWLPTHLWHAKRAKMTPPSEPLWRFAIPLTPTEKVYRPTHRASQAKGAIAWDMSYMSTIGLYGHESGIERTLRALGMSHDSLWDKRGQRWRDGRRKWSGILSKQNGHAKRQLGPATVLWNPETAVSASLDGTPQPAGKVPRQVYLRLHPSCFLEVFNILVKLTRRETPRLYVEDLRFEIGSIELTGPGAAETLLGILRPFQKGDTKEAHAKLFELLTDINSSILPPDSVLGFVSQDPRLHYPPQPAQTESANKNLPLDELNRIITDSRPSPFLLFDRNARFKASCFPTQKALNRRKGTIPPGRPLEITSADPPFPIVLMTSRSSAAKSAASMTWTLLAPWKCIVPIWYSIVHYPLSTGGNPRLGGLDELRQLTFEKGLPWFPGDFPGTDAGATWELEQRRERKAQWERRPKSKRVAWETLDLGAGRRGEIGLGWACEFERLFTLPETPTTVDNTNESAASKVEDVPNGDTTEMDVDTDEEHEGRIVEPKPNDMEGRRPRTKTSKAPANPLRLIQHLSKPNFNTLVTSKIKTTIPPYSIVTVKISLLGRGVVEPCARVYRLPAPRSAINTQVTTQPEVPATFRPSQFHILPADLRDQWLAKLSDTQNTFTSVQNNSLKSTAPHPFRASKYDIQKLSLARSLFTEKTPFPPSEKTKGRNINSEHPLVPSEEDLIGYVTKGEFSLAEGRAVAVASISVERALGALKHGRNEEGRVCIVRNTGETIGWIARWEVI